MSRLFIKAIIEALRNRLQLRLEVKEEDPSSRVSYSLKKVILHTDFLLTRSTLEEEFDTDSRGSTSVVTKIEDVDIEKVWDAVKSLQVQLENMRRRSPISTGESERSVECAFCGDLRHFIRFCPRVSIYIQAGKCSRGSNDRVTLPNEASIPFSQSSRNLMKKIDVISKAGSSQSINIVEVARTIESHPVFVAAFLESSGIDERDDYEIEQLEALLNEARKREVDAKKAKFDEVEVPFRSKVNEEKGHEYSNSRNSTHKQNEGNREASNLS